MKTQAAVDIVELLDDDHRELVDLLGRLPEVPIPELDEYFCSLVHHLVRHEVAEEVVLYPFVRTYLPRAQSSALTRLSEQANVERKLARMQKMNHRTDDFVLHLVELRKAVMEHISAEEDYIFALFSDLDADVAQDLGERFEIAKENGPTHPHPYIPNTPPANLILGPIAAIFDKTRDVARQL